METGSSNCVVAWSLDTLEEPPSHVVDGHDTDQENPDAIASFSERRTRISASAHTGRSWLEQLRNDSEMRLTYDRDVDAAYIYLTDVPLASGRDTIPVELPPDISGDVILDFKDGVLVGVEVLGAQSLLPRDLLDRAT